MQSGLLLERGFATIKDPAAKLVKLQSGHFAIEDSLEEIAAGISDFYDQVVAP